MLGLYFTTVLMSFGFHYYEAIQNSLSLQWIEKNRHGVRFSAGSWRWDRLRPWWRSDVIYAGLEQLLDLPYSACPTGRWRV